MIVSLKFKFGSSGGSAALVADIGPVTIFIGPNNSGKSKVLSEIESYCTHGTSSTSSVVIDHISFTAPKNVADELGKFTVTTAPDEFVSTGHIRFGNSDSYISIEPDRLKEILADSALNVASFANWYLKLATKKLMAKQG